jgi:hypothetical protein
MRIIKKLKERVSKKVPKVFKDLQNLKTRWCGSSTASVQAA